jgi:hypothetical protein
VASGLSAAFVSPDRLLFVADDALMMAGFDPDETRITAEARPVIAPVAGSSNFHAAFHGDGAEQSGARNHG